VNQDKESKEMLAKCMVFNGTGSLWHVLYVSNNRRPVHTAYAYVWTAWCGVFPIRFSARFAAKWYILQ